MLLLRLFDARGPASAVLVFAARYVARRRRVIFAALRFDAALMMSPAHATPWFRLFF